MGKKKPQNIKPPKLLPDSNVAKAVALLGHLQILFGLFLTVSYLFSAFSVSCSNMNLASVHTVAAVACILQLAAVWLIVWLIGGLHRHTSGWYYVGATVIPLLITLVSLFSAIGVSFALGSACTN